MARIKAHFLLPLRDNDGRDLAAEIEEVRDDLFVAFGGWTFQGYVKGTFLMHDRSVSVDTSASHFVVMEEMRIPELEKILHAFRSKTTQEAIYLEIHREVDIRFVK